MRNKLVVILGPTASGKTDLSLKIAKKFNGEIVSADSRQIYCGMDIGTAKPLDFKGIPHHLLNIKNPNQSYTVAEYKKEAIKIIKDIQKRDKLPIVVGGTGLYIKAVVDNLDIPKIRANHQLREKIEKDIQKRGLSYVFKKLIKIDPEAAYIIDPNNPRRVVRALEVTLLSKKPFSSQRKVNPPLFDFIEIGISLSKENLRKRINARVHRMIKDGLLDEVKNLVKKYGENQQAFEAIGYREIIKYLNKKITLKEAIKMIQLNSWRYAKRQMTWFRADKRIHWIKNQKEAEKLIKNFLQEEKNRELVDLY